jgi:dual specificity tyrosine-phosphorylation-regulated kinase 2/3/4
VEVLGEGSFGQVFKCLDHKKNKSPIALKIVKNNDKYANQAKI